MNNHDVVIVMRPLVPLDIDDGVTEGAARMVWTKRGNDWATTVGGSWVVVSRCARGWWLAQWDSASGDAGLVAAGATRESAVRGLVDGQVGVPCAGCACGRASAPGQVDAG